MLSLAQRIVARLAKPLATTIPVHDPRARLKGFGVLFSSPDESGRWEYKWPGSRLTGDDMRKLAVLGNYARLPSNELIHVAVGLLYEQTRAFILQLLATHEQTGKPFAALLADVVGTEPQVMAVIDEATPDNTSAMARPGLRLHLPLADPPAGKGDASWTTDAPPAMVAELVESVPRVQPLPPSTMSPRKASPVSGPRSTADTEPLVEEVGQLRDEIRVLWQAIDELRDAVEHTVRNLPDRMPSPVQIWSLPADPTAADFGQRINAVPAEQMEILRAEAVRAAEERPSPPGRQGRLFS